ncbi:WSC-domain-containing protein [Pholiota conissans]|uniref:WSC-domain-containing protein n=1 Tax=Pholiota conissans TaxID=109636 RepID=A0A9P5YQS1_9AGAR|nr:WSC-domain-containing protein [Pholiota conissans]
MKWTNLIYNALVALSLGATAMAETHGGIYTSLGCFNDSATHPALMGPKLLNQPDLSIDQCQAFCGPILYSGVEDGKDCYCGEAIEGGSVVIGYQACNVLCTGGVAYCGGVNAIQIFQVKDYVPPPLWTPLGCYTDYPLSRTLRAGSYIDTNDMSLEDCEDFCDGDHYTYAGVEGGNECYCDNKIHAPGKLTDALECDIQCSGDPDNTCGGSNRIEIFEKIRE